MSDDECFEDAWGILTFLNWLGFPAEKSTISLDVFCQGSTFLNQTRSMTSGPSGSSSPVKPSKPRASHGKQEPKARWRMNTWFSILILGWGP